MRFIAGFWLSEEAFLPKGHSFQRVPELDPWIEVNGDPLRSDTAWDAGQEPPSLFSRKLWLEQGGG
jgi:hypothetical protein